MPRVKITPQTHTEASRLATFRAAFIGLTQNQTARIVNRLSSGSDFRMMQKSDIAWEYMTGCLRHLTGDSIRNAVAIFLEDQRHQNL
jgi:hypothetical protein